MTALSLSNPSLVGYWTEEATELGLLWVDLMLFAELDPPLHLS